MYTNDFTKDLPEFLKEIKDKSCDWDHENYAIHSFLKENDVRIDSSNSDICKFLAGKSILITGGTGFLGKLLIEKLIRACIDIEVIYLLIRSKKGKDAVTRLTEIVNDVVFEKVASEYPEFKSKIEVVYGNVAFPGLGIKEFDRKMLTQKIDIIFHAAATTRFDEHISSAVAINVIGTREIIKLARDCEHLASFVYVSTAYSNCNRYEIEEKLYEPLLPPEGITSIVELLPKQDLQDITPMLLRDMPNTYTLTKQIAEYVVQTEGKQLPISVFRPSIVLSTYKEPIRGWTDNIFGPAGFCLGVALGVIRCMHGFNDYKCDLVPADYTINACIACAYTTAKHMSPNDKIKVYNFPTQKENPMIWGRLYSKKTYEIGNAIGSMHIVRSPGFSMVKSVFLYQLLNIMCHKLFAYGADAAIYLTGGKPRMVQAYRKIDKFSNALTFFATHQFDFETRNTNDLWNSLSPSDQKAFPFNMKTLDWKEYYVTLLVGLRVYLLKENLNNLLEGRAKMKRMYYYELAWKSFLCGVILYLFYHYIW